MNEDKNETYDNVSIDANMSVVEVESLDELKQHCDKIHKEGWEVCYIKAYIGIKKYSSSFDSTKIPTSSLQ